MFDLLAFFIFNGSENQQLVFLKLRPEGFFFRMLFSNSYYRCCYAHDMCHYKLQPKEACGRSYHIVELYLIPYLRKGCSGCGKCNDQRYFRTHAYIVSFGHVV